MIKKPPFWFHTSLYLQSGQFTHFKQKELNEVQYLKQVLQDQLLKGMCYTSSQSCQALLLIILKRFRSA